ncbi:extracellular solute-binding protein [Mollicutes bacterium LVI A0039]|nr:extracellular solute-binding protein [Mollicutes bacterium LVI A0039]
MKKLLISLVVFMAMLSGCSGSTSPTADSLEIFGWEIGGEEDEQAMFPQMLSEQLGVDVTTNVPKDDYVKQLAAALASGEIYDLIYIQQENYYDLVNQGALMDLTDLIASSDVLSNPDILDPEVYLDPIEIDGGVYALPTKYEGGLVAAVRNDWLKEFNMEAPTTLEEWEAYFAKCKSEKDAFGVTLRGIDYIQPWMSAFNITEGLVEVEDGVYTVPYASDDAAAAWEWWNKMYMAGYLEPNFETNGSSDFRDQFMSGKTGSVGYWWHWIGQFDDKVQDDSSNTQDTFDTIAAPAALAPDGSRTLSIGDLSLMAIPANADSPELAIKFFEWLYSDEGSMATVFGYEGHDYNITADGSIELTAVGEEHNLNHGAANPVNETWEMPEGFESPNEADELVARQYVDETGVPVIKNADYGKINEIVAKYASQIIKGKISGEEGTKAMQEEIAALSNDDVTYKF